MKIEKASQLKKFIGKRIEWNHSFDRHRGTCLCDEGVVNEVHGRNVKIDGEWRWFPDMHCVKVI